MVRVLVLVLLVLALVLVLALACAASRCSLCAVKLPVETRGVLGCMRGLGLRAV